MSNNEKRVVSKAIISILLGLNFGLFIIATVLPGINGDNFYNLLVSDTANTVIRVIILLLFAVSFIFSLSSIIRYIKNNQINFYFCFCTNIVISLIVIVLDMHFSIFTLPLRMMFLASIVVMLIGFGYFVYLAKKDYQCLFGVSISETGEVIYDEPKEEKLEEEKPVEEVVEVTQPEVVYEEDKKEEIKQEVKVETPVSKEIKEEKVNDSDVKETSKKKESKSKSKKVKEEKVGKSEVSNKPAKKESKVSKKETGKKKSSKKTSLFAKRTPIMSQELTKEDLLSSEEAKEQLTKEVKNDIAKAADEQDIKMGIGKEKDFKKYFVTLIISILALIGSYFAPIFIGKQTKLAPIDEFIGTKSYFTLALNIVYAIIVPAVLFAFAWLIIRRKEREEFENRVNGIIKFIFGFSIAYFIFGLVYFFIKMNDQSDKGNTYSFIFPVLMMVILIFNAIIKSKYQKEILFVDSDVNYNIDYSSAPTDEDNIREVKAFKRPFPSAELLFVNVIFTALPVICLFVDLFKITANGGFEKTIRAIDYIKSITTLNDVFQKAVAFIIFAELALLGILMLLYFISYFGRQKRFYTFSTINIVVSTVVIGLVTLYGLYYKIVQVSNVESITLLLAQFGVEEEVIKTIKETKVDTQSYFIFIAAIVMVLIVLIRNPMKKGAIYDELDDRQLLEARLNATPINKETLGEFIDNKLDKIPSENDAQNNDNQNGPVVENNEEITAEMPEAVEEEKVEILEDFDACPAFTELDSKVDNYNFVLSKRNEMKFNDLDLVKLSHFIINYAANSRLHLSYKYEDIAAFIAGLGCAKLTILQGMSGTGKTSLPKIFMEAIFGNCEIIEIESSWREKNELLGFYNEFSKMYTPKKFTQCLYKATLNQDVVTFIVLDEMNLSRIEYYFSDFLSLMENEEDKREIKLSNVKLYNIYDNERHSYISLKEDHTLKVPANVWFIGTANRDESTFEISDKVYDRAHTMNFNKRAPAIDKYGPEMKPKFMDYTSFKKILDDAKKSYKFDIEKNDTIKKVEQLLVPFNISFGNRIYRQIIDFVKVYCSCYSDPKKVEFDAVETILLTKVVMKLENKNIENKELLVHEFEKLKLKRCAEFISKLSED